jgi:glycosyltransferase involved in cell wall biosynthesis
MSLQGLLTACERVYFRGLTWGEVARLTLRKRFALGRGEIQGYWRCQRRAALEREIIRTNHFFIGRTEWDKAFLGVLNPAATYYHCDEILRSPFYDAVWQHDAGRSRTVFCTSSTSLYKGAECLIEALALLRHAGYDDVRLRIAGIPPQGDETEFYAARARKHGVTSAIDWLGRIKADRLVSELLQASVFAYPSHIDNSPNALSEALLVGVPSVASYVGGVPSLLADGREGLLFPDADPFALAGRIRYMLDNPHLAAEMGSRARERALRRHDPQSIVERLLNIYREVLQAGGVS